MTKDDVLVRKADLDDAEYITNFNLELAEQTERKRLERGSVLEGVKAVIRDKSKGFYLVAEKRGAKSEVVGQLMITFEWSDWRNKYYWWLQSVYIRKEHRNSRIFHRIYSELIKIAESRRNVYALRLYVDKNNKHAKEVYGALGMTKTAYEVYESHLNT